MLVRIVEMTFREDAAEVFKEARRVNQRMFLP